MNRWTHTKKNSENTKETPFLVCCAPTICKHSLFIYVSVFPISFSLIHSFRTRSISLYIWFAYTCTTVHDFSIFIYLWKCISIYPCRPPCKSDTMQYIQPNSNFVCMQCAEFTSVSFWATSWEFGVQVHLVVSAIHDNYMDRFSISFFLKLCTIFSFTLPRPKLGPNK